MKAGNEVCVIVDLEVRDAVVISVYSHYVYLVKLDNGREVEVYNFDTFSGENRRDEANENLMVRTFKG